MVRRNTSRDKSDDKKKLRKDKAAPKKRLRYLDGVKEINPTDYEFLQKFLTEQGKIVAARLTGATAKQQRQIKSAVRRARIMGLLP